MIDYQSFFGVTDITLLRILLTLLSFGGLIFGSWISFRAGADYSDFISKKDDERHLIYVYSFSRTMLEFPLHFLGMLLWIIIPQSLAKEVNSPLDSSFILASGYVLVALISFTFGLMTKPKNT